MPHHSSPSWQAYVRRVLPEELDTIRKKVGIARRKAAEAGSNSRTNPLDQVQIEAGPSDRAKLSPPAIDEGMPSVEATTLQDLQQQDFENICQFFASGGGDNSDDEAVWESLAAYVSIIFRFIRAIYLNIWTATLQKCGILARILPEPRR
jgi:hypothetical protein